MKPRSAPLLTLFAGMLVTGTLGSVHAFSVLIVSLEQTFDASRSEVSLVYSIALVSLTGLVLLGHRLYDAVSAPLLAALACGTAAAGLCVAAFSPALWGVYVGYGLIFGAANGVGYGFTLQLVAQSWPSRRGLAMGLVTAVYAVGAVVFSKVFASLLEAGSAKQAMLILAGILVATALVVYVILHISGARFSGESKTDARSDSDFERRLTFRLWFGYGTGAAAGLMAIGHATAIVIDAGGQDELIVAGAMMIGAGNALGGVVAGTLGDRVNLRQLLMLLPAMSSAALCALWLTTSPIAAVGLLAVIGFAYGALIAVYPLAISIAFGPQRSARVYGRVFTAWGCAGLGAPWIAGVLFDAYSSYSGALAVAAAAGFASVVSAARFPDTMRHTNTPQA